MIDMYDNELDPQKFHRIWCSLSESQRRVYVYEEYEKWFDKMQKEVKEVYPQFNLKSLLKHDYKFRNGFLNGKTMLEAYEEANPKKTKRYKKQVEVRNKIAEFIFSLLESKANKIILIILAVPFVIVSVLFECSPASDFFLDKIPDEVLLISVLAFLAYILLFVLGLIVVFMLGGNGLLRKRFLIFVIIIGSFFVYPHLYGYPEEDELYYDESAEYSDTAEEDEVEYVYNTSTLKIHRPDCEYVDRIAYENYADSSYFSFDTAIERGYSTCLKCKPH